ncbi:hypothetical protein, partial [Arenimonas sp. MALMAid1274]|uniref:hypothetical protein n=1 Tax=Arenimonas sp. MALMAid1274 TaxID=3411630 RepID=UPI003B9FDB08
MSSKRMPTFRRLHGAVFALGLAIAGSAQAQNYPPNITNTVTVTAPNGTLSTASDVNALIDQANLGITKTVDVAAPAVGSNVVFTLTVTNAGPAPALGVSVTDLLPAGYTFVAATPSVGTYASGTGVWTIGTMANGATVTMTIQATVNATGSYANSATVNSTTPDPVPGNNSDTETPAPVAQADVSITKAVDDPIPDVGENVTFTLTVSNAGPSAAAGVSVNDLLPAGYTFVSSAASTGTYNSGTGVWAIGGLANGASATLDILATVNAAGPYDNTASVTATTADPTPGNNSDTETPAPQAVADLTVTKTLTSASPVQAGAAVSYEINVSNGGPSDVADAIFSDTAPAGLVGAQWTCAPLANCGVASGNGDVSLLLDLAAGQSVTITMTGTAPVVTPATVAANTASVTAPAGVTDPDLANNTDTVPAITVDPLAIDAVNDSAGPVNGFVANTNVVNVLGNDQLNGAAVNPADITLVPVTNGPLTVNADGSVDVAAGTAAGTYTVDYEICEVLNPANCDTATVTVTVEAAVLDAVNDTAGPINGVTGGTNVVNVLANDQLNGAPVNPANITLVPVTNGPLTVNADGSVDVAPNTPAGTYTVDYEICEVLNPANCDTATVTVTVEEGVIDAVNDSAGPVNGFVANANVVNVLSNDLLNGAAVNPADITLVPVTNGPLTVNADGSVDVAPNTPAGTYTVDYEICEVLNPANCDTA